VLTAESLDPGEPLHDFFVERYEMARTFVRSLLERDQVRGAIRPDIDTEQIANEVISVAIGAEIQWLLDPGAFDLGGVFERYVDRLSEGLSVSAPRRRNSGRER
jgi:hypothetical protein